MIRLKRCSVVNGDHIGEAIQYLSLDREEWLGRKGKKLEVGSWKYEVKNFNYKI